MAAPYVRRHSTDIRLEGTPSLSKMPVSTGRATGAAFDLGQKFGPHASILRSSEYSDLRKSSNKMLSSEANELYGNLGLHFDDHEEISRDYVEKVAEEKRKELQMYELMERAEGGGLLRFGAMMAGAMTDPVNLATMFIPIINASTYLRMGARMGVTGARLARGSIEGAVGISLVEPITLAVAREEQANYGLFDAMVTILGGTVFGGALRAGTGKVLGDMAGFTSFKGDVAKVLPFKDNVRLFESAVFDVEHGRSPVLASALLDQIEVKANNAVDSVETVGSISLAEGEAIAGIDIDLDAVHAILDKIKLERGKSGQEFLSPEDTVQAIENAYKYLDRATTWAGPGDRADFFNKTVLEVAKLLKPHQKTLLETHQGGSLGSIVQEVLSLSKSNGSYKEALQAKKWAPSHKKKIETFIEEMEDTISAYALSRAIKLWRGQSLSKEAIDGLLEQVSIFKESGTYLKLKMNTFFGGSLNERKGAEFFTAAKYGIDSSERPVLFSINVPEGTKAAVPQAASDSPKHGTFVHEQEFILSRHTTLLIKDIQTIENYTVAGKNFGTIYKVSAHVVPEGNKSSLASASIKETDDALKRLLDIGYTKQDLLDEPLILDLAIALKSVDFNEFESTIKAVTGVNDELQEIMLTLDLTPEEIKLYEEVNANFVDDQQIKLAAFAAAGCLGKA